jgi:hypothetical protein
MARPQLPDEIRDRIASMPEYRYGVNRVVLILKDGTEIADVKVAWAGEIVSVGGGAEWTFDPADVVDVRNQP